MIVGSVEYIRELRQKLHNTKQRVESLRKRRKHLRGRHNAALAEIATVEALLTSTNADIEAARAMLQGMRLALDDVERHV